MRAVSAVGQHSPVRLLKLRRDRVQLAWFSARIKRAVHQQRRHAELSQTAVVEIGPGRTLRVEPQPCLAVASDDAAPVTPVIATQNRRRYAQDTTAATKMLGYPDRATDVADVAFIGAAIAIGI